MWCHGREMRVRRDEDPRRNLGVVGEPKKGRGDRGPPLLGGADMSLHIVSMCQNSGANRDSSHLAEDSFTHGRDETRVALTALSYYFSFVCPGFVREPLAYTYIHIHMLRG